MSSAARLLAAWVAATLVTVSTAARAQDAKLTPAERSQVRRLELHLDDVRGERVATSTVLPWTVVAIGVTSMVVGTVIGFEKIYGCDDDSCSSPFWPTWLVAGGAGVATAGVIWLRLVSEDIAELESRRYQLQMQLDAYETLRQARGERALLQIRGTF
jgi:hypothetical protein